MLDWIKSARRLLQDFRRKKDADIDLYEGLVYIDEDTICYRASTGRDITFQVMPHLGMDHFVMHFDLAVFTRLYLNRGTASKPRTPPRLLATIPPYPDVILPAPRLAGQNQFNSAPFSVIAEACSISLWEFESIERKARQVVLLEYSKHIEARRAAYKKHGQPNWDHLCV